MNSRHNQSHVQNQYNLKKHLIKKLECHIFNKMFFDKLSTTMRLHIPSPKPIPIQKECIKEKEEKETFALYIEPKSRQPPKCNVKYTVPAKQIYTKSNVKKKDYSVIKYNNTNNRFFYPEQKDQLFWCYYIMKHGYASYEYFDTTTFVNEKKNKIQCIEKLREGKQLLKIKKIKNIKEDVEDELGNRERIGMKTFLALCCVDQLNVMFKHNRTYFEIIDNDDSNVHVVHCYDKPLRYCYENDVTKDIVEKYRNDYFKLENVDKPLKAISSYKVCELEEIYTKLGGYGEKEKDATTSTSKQSKKELYEFITMKLT